MNPNFEYLRQITEDHSRFEELFSNPSSQIIQSMYESIDSLLNEVISIVRLSKNSQSIFFAAPELASSDSTEESIKTLTQYLCKTIECENAVVYAIDHQSGQLWSQISKDRGESHTVQLGQGLLGYAAA